ncbi:hypothetical protein Pmani_032767 [Petrolisthes manimaculis]|uniref:Corticotropin-releasing factor domain-containing protein n=1 Tax=Petrolisthes manimaculis TaxID=1843537 RepID=A0AAE1TRC2_9EUCA|nr:hypothetical protein Pmani_032767 [Petrolisthes manimaculis]
MYTLIIKKDCSVPNLIGFYTLLFTFHLEKREQGLAGWLGDGGRRKARNSLDINNNNNNNKDSGASGSSTENNNNNNIGLNKRTWPHGFSRRRSGLSLSIDASMKVLREALYLEIARKKQRQQLQRAQHNKALLNTIGKRDVSAQLRTPARDSSPSSSSSSSSSTPTLAERN